MSERPSEDPGLPRVLRRSRGDRVILLLNLSIPRFGKYLWPLALIAIGVAVIVQASASRR